MKGSGFALQEQLAQESNPPPPPNTPPKNLLTVENQGGLSEEMKTRC